MNLKVPQLMSGYEKIADCPPIPSSEVKIEAIESYQALPSSLHPQITTLPPFPSSPLKPSPQTTEKRSSSFTKYERQTIEYRREGDTLIVWGKTFDVKEIFKVLCVATWNKESKHWILSGMGDHTDKIIFYLDILKEMQKRDMIKSKDNLKGSGKGEKK